jgi:hypothetical protein
MLTLAAAKSEMKPEILEAIRQRVEASKWRDPLRDSIFATFGESGKISRKLLFGLGGLSAAAGGMMTRSKADEAKKKPAKP